jgi:hypothetical protein
MQDLEQRAQQLVRDWQALRQRLECVQQEQRFGQFYTMHLDAIEASLVDVPGLVYCIVTDMTTPDPAAGISTTAPSRRVLQPQREDGFASLIRRTRQAAEDIDMDD